jgi:hypothetical protein
MRHLASVIGLLLLSCACGQGPRNYSGGSGLPSGPTSGPSSTPSLHPISGNWQFNATSSVLGGPPSAQLAGSITQSGSSLVGAVHVNGWACFDQSTVIGLNGNAIDGKVLLTSTSIDGQVLILEGKIIQKGGFPDTFTGTYTITGGCANGDHGSATGYAVHTLTGYWAGNLTTDGGTSIHWDTQLTQENPTSDGRFGLNGTVDFYDCFPTGTIVSGTSANDSFVLGTSVDLQIKTDAASITFVGTADPDGLIRGTYTASGGSCELSGTAYLSPWEY